MKYIIVLLFSSYLVTAQTTNTTSQFKTLQENLVTQNWDLIVNGILLSENIALTVRQFEYTNFEIAIIEVPILLKIKLTDKLSVYRCEIRFL
ncbi:hypothetical protein [Winogradskyella sp. UBA3174]|uniref:hypothetical protein n=1 Tax=Winogradskyella sp. UBA3174 TaxID=1947785 RepID=UPI0025DD1F1D|nr:hypothetical protein [Winogradskyella sp. UBA3174]